MMLNLDKERKVGFKQVDREVDLENGLNMTRFIKIGNSVINPSLALGNALFEWVKK